jgi:flagella basal body P-ring formation protein FlgA
MMTRRYIATGAPFTAADVTEPYDVDRGETVMVEVQSGGAVLTLEAEAQASGRRDQSIPFKNSTSGKIFHAKITGKGRALVESHSPGI